MPGMNDDLDGDLLGDFGDDFNILDFAEGLDGDGAKGMNILDDLEAEETKEGDKADAAKPPPYIGGLPGQQPPQGQGQPPPPGGQQPHDPSRPPPPPYPGQQKQVGAWPHSELLVDWGLNFVCPFNDRLLLSSLLYGNMEFIA